MKKFDLLISQCDSDIRAGRVRDVRRHLARVNSARVPREARLPLANICRRAGLYSHGLTLLRRIVYPTKGKLKDLATPKELAEYGVLLLRSGAVPEALALLEKIEIARAPEALLYRAFGHFTRWEFRQAIPVLNRYLDHSLEPYAKMIALTNLAYAYAYSSWEEEYFEPALRLSQDNIRLAKDAGYTQLEKSGRAILAQVYVQKNELQLARQEIDSARSNFALETTNDHFLVNKWGLILEGLGSSGSKSSQAFESVRSAAVKSREWEALREADFYSLKVEFNTARFLHLYFGSPYEDFRRRCLSEFGRQPDRATYILGSKSSPRFDLNTGEIDGALILSPGRQCHQLIEVLLRDFYQPLSVTGIFSAAFPDEHFDVASSPGRVHQMIRRTRQWITQQSVPVELVEENGFYSIRNNGDFSFRVPIQRQPLSSPRAHFERLKTLLPANAAFSAYEVQERLNLTTPTAYRLVSKWVEAGWLHARGIDGRTVTYGFTASQKAA